MPPQASLLGIPFEVRAAIILELASSPRPYPSKPSDLDTNGRSIQQPGSCHVLFPAGPVPNYFSPTTSCTTKRSMFSNAPIRLWISAIVWQMQGCGDSRRQVLVACGGIGSSCHGGRKWRREDGSRACRWVSERSRKKSQMLDDIDQVTGASILRGFFPLSRSTWPKGAYNMVESFDGVNGIHRCSVLGPASVQGLCWPSSNYDPECKIGI
ncbi:hypothetical protein B0T16DRAFT_189398 [Cercophora newfieldiana]|uniref:Uncharacterized protein n=1 Tax=Cercophora newfieldiana TaxID=92897 RepID=A0AA39Y0N9_9PEZI|nr:hypothetical protein B0T16DRAFT_189398 [Cercophora newfieldiana]